MKNNIKEEELIKLLTEWFDYAINKNKFNNKYFMRKNKVLLVLKKHLSLVGHWRKKQTEGLKYKSLNKKLNSLNNLKLFEKGNKNTRLTRDKCENNKKTLDSSDILSEALSNNIGKHNNYKIPIVPSAEKDTNW